MSFAIKTYEQGNLHLKAVSLSKFLAKKISGVDKKI
jgi:hypothetical protein